MESLEARKVVVHEFSCCHPFSIKVQRLPTSSTCPHSGYAHTTLYFCRLGRGTSLTLPHIVHWWRIVADSIFSEVGASPLTWDQPTLSLYPDSFFKPRDLRVRRIFRRRRFFLPPPGAAALRAICRPVVHPYSIIGRIVFTQYGCSHRFWDNEQSSLFLQGRLLRVVASQGRRGII